MPDPTPAPSVEPSAEPSAELRPPTPPRSRPPLRRLTRRPRPAPAPAPRQRPPRPRRPSNTPGSTRSTTTGAVAAQGRLDSALGDAARFTVYLVRFQVVNHGDTDATVTPVLEVGGSADWTALPLVDPVAGTPFYGASDAGEVFDAAARDDRGLRAPTARRPRSARQSGRRPVQRRAARSGPSTCPAHSFTEIEFAVRATVDAAWGERYAFRLVDGSDVLAGAPPAELVMGAQARRGPVAGTAQGKPTTDPVPLYRFDPSIGLTDTSIAQVRGRQRRPVQPPRRRSRPRGRPDVAPRPCAGWPRTRARRATRPMTAQGPMLLQQPDPQSGDLLHLPRWDRRAERRPSGLGEPGAPRQRPGDELRVVLPPGDDDRRTLVRRRGRVRRACSTGTRCARTATSPTSRTGPRPSRARAAGPPPAPSGRVRASAVDERRGGLRLRPTRWKQVATSSTSSASSATRATRRCRRRTGSSEPLGPGQGHRAQPGQRLVPPVEAAGNEPDAQPWP